MPFDRRDPRAALGAAGGGDTATATAFAAAQFLPFIDDLAISTGEGTRTWFVRTQNAGVAYSEGAAGDRLTGFGDAAERIVAWPDGDALAIEHDGERAVLIGPGIAVLPPGRTVLTLGGPGRVVQLFTSAATDVLARSHNAEAYRTPPPNVNRHEPEPARERGIRVHLLADHPPTGRRFGSIVRSTNLMLNVVDVRHGPRDVTALSPHIHEDFEQCSIQLEGEFCHHVRTPWTPDMRTWREDQHVEVKGAGAIIFPPPLVHTSQATGSGANRLLDLFAPPRRDFLERPGWVLNDADYPR